MVPCNAAIRMRTEHSRCFSYRQTSTRRLAPRARAPDARDEVINQQTEIFTHENLHIQSKQNFYPTKIIRYTV